GTGALLTQDSRCPCPEVLHYVTPGHDRNWFEAICQTAKDMFQLGSYACDEYPYASTTEGGPGSSVALVPSGENSSHGSLLFWFYVRCTVIPDGYSLLSVFRVVVGEKTGYTCRTPSSPAPGLP